MLSEITKRLIALWLCVLCGVFASHAADVTYTTIHTTAIEGEGQSGMLNALVEPGRDTTEVLQSITALQISGTLNGTDCLILRNKLPNLAYLDMTDVEFVTGGNSYYNNSAISPDKFPSSLFYECVVSQSLISIILPNSIKSVGEQAFSGCANLESVYCGASMTDILSKAFKGCTNLQTVVFDEKLTSIGPEAFSGCKKLFKLNLPSGLVTLERMCFNGCSSIDTLVVPDLVSTISSQCFNSCSNLKNVTLGRGLKQLDSSCFASCSNLTEVTFNDGLLTIANDVFSNCGQLKEALLPNSLTTISDKAFSGCSALKTFRFPLGLTSLGNSVFSGCNSIEKIYAPYINPIVLSPETFTGGTNGQLSKATLYVPVISYYAYFWDNSWGAFRNIMPDRDPQLYENDLTLSCNGILSANMPDFLPGSSNQMGYYVSGTLTVEPTGSLTVENGVSQGFNRVLLSSSGDVHPALINHGGLRINHLNFEFPIRGGEWRLFTVPRNLPIVASSNNKGVCLPSGADVRVYDGTQRASNGSGWKTFTGTSFEVGKGYAIYVPTDAMIKVYTTTQTVSESDVNCSLSAYSSSTTANAGWNLLGNPYLSYYDIADLNLSDPVVVLDEGQYVTYYPGDHYMLAPYQAFFVKRNSCSSISFKKDRRTIYKLGNSPRKVVTRKEQTASGNPPEPVISSQVCVSCDPEDAGVATGGGLYSLGQYVTLSVTAHPEYQVDHWTFNGSYYAGSLNSLTYIVGEENALFVAVMSERNTDDPGYDPTNPDDPEELTTEAPQVPLILKVSPAGKASFEVNDVSVNANIETLVSADQFVHLKCKPNDNFVFKGWYRSGSLISNEKEFDYSMPHSAVTLMASVEYSPSNPNDPDTPQDDIDNGQGIILGDVNEDGTVDVTDAIQLAVYLKDPSTDPQHLLLIRCDMNLDGVVDEEDIPAIVDDYLQRVRFSEADMLARKDTIADMLTLSSITLEPGGASATLRVNLNASAQYTALAFDLVLPPGMDVDTTPLVTPVGTHTLCHSLLLDGGQVLRIVCYDAELRTFPTSLGVLLQLPLSEPPYTYPGELSIGVRHATLITPQVRAYVPGSEGGNVSVSAFNHIPVSVSDENKYSTLILPFRAELPDGLRAAEGKNGNDTCLFLSEVEILEPFTPYVIYAQNGINTVFEGDYRTDLYVPSATVGYLTGVVHDTAISEGYVMQNHGQGVAFYMVLNNGSSQVVLPAGKAYLKRSDGASMISIFRYDADEYNLDTALEECHDDIPTRVYNLQGMRADVRTGKGVYLSSHHKLIIR